MTRNFKTKEVFINEVTKELAFLMEESINLYGNANILLSGGSTPGPVYRELDKRFESFNDVNIGLVDERFVKSTSDYSNEGLLRECFSSREEFEYAIQGMVLDLNDKNNNIKLLESHYNHFSERTDVVVLGMGKDGHTASIFPGDVGSAEAMVSQDAFLNTLAPTFPENRITCSMSLICRANHILLLITGREKWDVLFNSSVKLPIHEVLERRSDVKIFYVD